MRIFLWCSQDSADREFAAWLSGVLRGRGHRIETSVRRDGRGPGIRGSAAIHRRLDGCEALLVVRSRFSARDRGCRRAGSYASARGIPVIALRIDADMDTEADAAPSRTVDFSRGRFGGLRHLSNVLTGLAQGHAEVDDTPLPTPTTDAPIGREREFGALRAVLEAGDPPFVVVSGPPGAGKSTLVRAELSRWLDDEIRLAGGATVRYHLARPGQLLGGGVLTGDTAAPLSAQDVHTAIDRARGARLVVAIDAAENLLDEADHRMLDMDLDDVFDLLYRRRGQHRIQIVLSTREEPRASPGHSWMLSAKRVRLDDGIPPTDFGHLLRRLDHHGDVVPPETSEAVITQACRITGGHPRLAELLIAYASREYRTLDRTVKMLSAVPAARVPELLYDRLLRSLDPLPRQALEAVAAFGAPVDEKQVGAVLPGRYEPRMLENVLRWLVRRRLLETAAGLFYLRAPDTQRVLAAKGPQSRPLLLRAATVLGRGEKPDPDRAEDFTARTARIDVLLTAGEFDEAYNLMDGISRQLYDRNRGDLLFRQRLRVRGQLADRFDELLNYNALGDVYLRKGRYEDARNAYERSIHLAADADPVVHKRALVNLATAVFNLRDTAKAFSSYRLALDLAADRRSEQAEPRKGLADCYRRWGRIDSAIAQLEAARRGLRPGLRWGRLGLTIARLHIEADRPAEAEAEVANVAAEVGRTEHRRLHASCWDAHAYLLAVANRPAEAIAAARQAVDQATLDGDPVVLGYARTTLAYTYLLGNRPGRAADAIDPVARDRPEGSQLQVLALRALSRLRRDRFAAVADFAQLRDEASRNIARDDRDFAAHDFLGFAASGLHICRGEPLGPAVQAFQRSQADRPAGLTKRLLALLNMLDDEDRLTPVCDVLNGKPGTDSADQARPPSQPSA